MAASMATTSAKIGDKPTFSKMVVMVIATIAPIINTSPWAKLMMPKIP